MNATLSLNVEYLSIELTTDWHEIEKFFGSDGCIIDHFMYNEQPHLHVLFNTNHDVYVEDFLISGQTVYYQTQTKNHTRLGLRKYLYRVMDTPDFLEAVKN